LVWVVVVVVVKVRGRETDRKTDRVRGNQR
jgi:hypothetical protein